MSSLQNDLYLDGPDRLSALGTALSSDALEGVAREVVNRLAAQRQMPGLAEDRDHPDAALISGLADALIGPNPAEARDMLRQLQREGLPLSILFARYLAAAAAKLGQMWDDDVIGFSQVTIGVGRINDIIRVLRDALPPSRITRTEPVLFASVPGERHSVGLQMAAELFRQRGWDVHILAGASHDQILAELGMARFLVIGLSSAGRATAEALARLIHAIRVAHPEMFVLVSGKIVNEDADLVALMAPDGAVSTVEDALATIEALANR